VAEVLLDRVGVGGAHEGDELRQVDATQRTISGRRRQRRRGRRRAALCWRWRRGEDEPARKLLLLPAVGEDAAQAEMWRAELRQVRRSSIWEVEVGRSSSPRAGSAGPYSAGSGGGRGGAGGGTPRRRLSRAPAAAAICGRDGRAA
jgi:hypothetical protein